MQPRAPRVLFQLAEPYGMAVDSKNNIYIADQKVGAIFIFNTETREVEMIKNKDACATSAASSGWRWTTTTDCLSPILDLHHVLVFNKDTQSGRRDHRWHGGARRHRHRPAKTGCSMSPTSNSTRCWCTTRTVQAAAQNRNHRPQPRADNSGRFLPSPQESRWIKKAISMSADTLNNRIEIFDADGKFIRAFGKTGDGPGYFARPKGIAIDGDGHIWVADGHAGPGAGLQPGEPVADHIWWTRACCLANSRGWSASRCDKNNRVFTSEIFPGRVQQFRT